MTGKTIGKYRILGRLGSGGMGTVYKALDETLEREVAIKVLNPGLTDPKILKRFRAEATTLAKLNHPAIATIYELFQCDEELLIVMEFVRGETLESLTLRMGRLIPEQAVLVVDQVLSALAHTHRAGIVHCDIKPANVMVTVHGDVKMMDFGTARARGAEHGAVQGYMMGTPAYMPPEQLLGHQLDGRTDLYAVGVLFYRLVTGTFPFTGDTPIEAMRKQIADAPTPAVSHRPELPDWCDYIVLRALAKLPAHRFQTADGFRDALRDASGFAIPEAATALLAPMVSAVGSSREPAIAEPLDIAAQQIGTEPAAHESAPRTQAWRSRRSTWRRPLVKAIAVTIPLMAVATLRAPASHVDEIPSPARLLAIPVSGLPAPQLEPEPEKPIGIRTPTAFAFQARVVAGNQKSSQECKCRVLLANGRIIWRAEDKHSPIYAVGYDQVASIVYSHGRDPLWHGPGGPTPVVRASRGPFGALGLFTERDWLALRVTESPLRFVVLRFDDGAQAKSAISALEERTGRRIERLSKRQS